MHDKHGEQRSALPSSEPHGSVVPDDFDRAENAKLHAADVTPRTVWTSGMEQKGN
jgi:hypothetical protein